MLRPVSRAFEMEFDLDKALEEIPIHIEDPPFSSSRLDKRSSGFISELPSEEGKKLEHFTKLRPKRNKKQQPTQAAVTTTATPQDGEQNGLMGRVDEGVDEFFTKKVTKMESKKLSTKSSDASDTGEAVDEKKKRDSRKSGFLNLIKSRSKSERPQTVTVSEEPLTPKGVVKGPTTSDSTKKETKPVEHNGSTEKTEELKTPDSIEEASLEDAAKSEKSDSKGSPQGGRRYGVQVMGSGLLAEMKAKQERRAASAQKKFGNDARDLADLSVNSERLDGSNTAKFHQASPENRFALSKGDSITASSEKITKTEPKTETVARTRSSSGTKPPLQSTKPSLAGRPTVPQKPRSASRTGPGISIEMIDYEREGGRLLFHYSHV
ncbi:UNVERIFIED_CONTAM: F-actin-uncapping protein LRRC16A [Gekko kuhli]